MRRTSDFRTQFTVTVAADVIRDALANAYQMGEAKDPRFRRINEVTCLIQALDQAGFEIVPKAVMGNVVALTPAGEDAIRRFVDAVDLTQEAVSAGGADLERLIEADPDRYLRDVSGRDHAVDPRALAVRDTIEANRLLGMAVATLGHEAFDTLMRNLPEPVLGAA